MSYGLDLSTFPNGGGVDIDPGLLPISGPRGILELCARRLMTPRGLLDDAPDGGFDLMAQMGRRINAVTKIRLKADIENECERVKGVLSAKVNDFSDQGGGVYRIRIMVTLAEGEFSLVLDASSIDVTIIRADKG